MQPTDCSLWIGETVIALHQQIAPVTRNTDRRFGGVQSVGARKRKSEGFVLDTARKPF